MTISTTGANIVVLYGDEAVSHYVELVQQWSEVLSADDWSSIYFLLVAKNEPEYGLISENVWTRVGQITTFCDIEGEALSTEQYTQVAFELPNAGSPNLHLICATGNEHCTYSWLEKFVSNVLQDGVHFTQFLLYFMLAHNSLPAEREGMLNVLHLVNGKGRHCNTFFAGDVDDGGTKVDDDARWNALYLSTVLNSAAKLPLSTEAYSLGYSVLNANGSELKNMRLRTACDVLLDRLKEGTLSQTEAVAKLLPTGVDGDSGLQAWLQKHVESDIHLAKSDFYNVWITIRMNPDMDGTEVCRRLQRFADLNYCRKDEMAERANALAQQVKSEVIARLCQIPETAAFPVSTVTQVIAAFERLARDEVRVPRCEFGRKPFLKIGHKMEQYLDENKQAAYKAVTAYVRQMNVKAYAEAMTEAYHFIESWISNIRSSESQNADITEYLRKKAKKLDREDSGNVARLRKKYAKYAQELDKLHPSLSDITGTMKDINTYFDNSGACIEKGWNILLDATQKVLKSQLPGKLSRSFFDVLQEEFDEDRLAGFFQDYLKPGKRMYYNMRAQTESMQSFYLVDENLAEEWTDSPKDNLFEVRTDNAENLTLYPMAGRTAAEYLSDDSGAYFLGKKVAGLTSVGDQKMSHPLVRPVATSRKLSSDDDTDNRSEKIVYAKENAYEVKLQPNAKNHYMLSWKWDGNEKLAKVFVSQYGEAVGEPVVIDVGSFMKNNCELDVTAEVMNGKQIPYGELEITIYSNKMLYIDHATVRGRCEQVNYRMQGKSLELSAMSSSTILERLALRITNNAGQFLYFPLYAASTDKPYVFEELNLRDAKLVEAPAETNNNKVAPIFTKQID